MESAEYLRNYDGPPVRIMEVCGTHTAAIFKSGLRSFLSPEIKLVSGPGCPVCVTEPSYIDRCIGAAMRPGHELITFGDLMKVPGTLPEVRTLSDAKGAGGRVRMAWSPFDAISLAKNNPEIVFVLAAIGFETTSPAFALLIEEAKREGVNNLNFLTSLKSAIRAIEWICETGEKIDGFLCPGHVSVVTGASAYVPLAEKYKKPFIIAGFEGEHLLDAIAAAVRDAADGLSVVRNLYPEAVRDNGNEEARKYTSRYFERGDAVWRGLGVVSDSGYYLRDQVLEYDDGNVTDSRCLLSPGQMNRPLGSGLGFVDNCRCGEVVLGRIDPDECPLFGTSCTPENAIGPCMVSSEGACGYWYRSR